jgi:hypothetical protein
MSNETKIAAASDDYERRYYDELTARYGEGAPLPEPVSANEWAILPGVIDGELIRLAQEKENNLNAKVSELPFPESSDRVFDAREGILRARTSRESNIKMYDRWKELQQGP